MPHPNSYLLIFAVGFLGCVLATPVVTRFATWLGAIDRPDQFRRIHKGATPRLGGLGLAFALLAAVAVAAAGHHFRGWDDFPHWIGTLLPIGLAALIILGVGVVDDTREMPPRMKLLGQAAAVLVLYAGGVRIDGISVLHLEIPLDRPALDATVGGFSLHVAIPGLLVTLFWFLACINIWNLIDGMDGLASGVGLMVSGTLALVAIWLDNPAAAILAAALAGGLAGFLLYNWHPACIFLGDSGSLLIGLTIGIIGIQGSSGTGSSTSLLFPILAMGLPITDTAMAIFRRWVRNLPLSSADRRHVHHLLIGLGLNPRQAAVFLYCFSSGLCGVVMIGVVCRSEALALVLGLAGCAAFLLVLTSRRDELSTLRADLAERMARRQQERFAAKVTWEAIQRIELAEGIDPIWGIVRQAADRLGCARLEVTCRRDGREVFAAEAEAEATAAGPGRDGHPLSGPSAAFRLSGGGDLALVVAIETTTGSPLAADIAFRFMQRLAVASAERIARLASPAAEPLATPPPAVVDPARPEVVAAAGIAPLAASPVLPLDPSPMPAARPPLARFCDLAARSLALLTPGRRPVGED